MVRETSATLALRERPAFTSALEALVGTWRSISLKARPCYLNTSHIALNVSLTMSWMFFQSLDEPDSRSYTIVGAYGSIIISCCYYPLYIECWWLIEGCMYPEILGWCVFDCWRGNWWFLYCIPVDLTLGFSFWLEVFMIIWGGPADEARIALLLVPLDTILLCYC